MNLDIFQKTLFSSIYVLQYLFYIGIFYLKASRNPLKGLGGLLRRVRGGQSQLHPPTPYNWTNLDSGIIQANYLK